VWLGGTSNVCVDDVYSAEEWDEDNEDALRYPATFSASDLEGMSPYDSGIDIEVTADDITTLLAAKFSPSLTHLELGAPRWTPELLDAVAGGGLTKTVKSLTISGGKIDDKAVKSITKKAFGHLENFQVTSSVDKDVAAKLKKSFPDLELRIDGEREDFHFRYVATVE